MEQQKEFGPSDETVCVGFWWSASASEEDLRNLGVGISHDNVDFLEQNKKKDTKNAAVQLSNLLLSN